jgi:dipeptidyl aminopeptidase/acylaminoacyl peptidase
MAGGGAAKSPTPANSPRGILAFALSSRIETLDLMTRRVRAITSGLDDLPAWSPDGKKLAFVRGQSGVYVIRGDGSGVRRVLPIAGRGATLVDPPQWSPDGGRIAFDRWSDVECTLKSRSGSASPSLRSMAGVCAKSRRYPRLRPSFNLKASAGRRRGGGCSISSAKRPANPKAHRT